MADPARPAPAGRRAVGVIWAVALLLAALPWAAGGLQGAQTALDDAQARLFAPRGAVPGVLLVDIDEPSVQALRPHFGGWPPSRDLLARVTAHLLDGGARAVVFTLVLTDPREGDEALAAVIAAHPGRVVLAASVRPALLAPSALSSTVLAPISAPVDTTAPLPPGCAAAAWPGLLLPAPTLMAASPRLGMVSTLPDADGLLRAWPLWHTAPGQTLPSLPLAAVLAAGGHGKPTASPTSVPTRLGQDDRHCNDNRWTLGTRPVPTEAHGAMHPAFHARADAVRWRSYKSVARAALAGEPAAADVRGQVVVIGASAALGDRVQTAVGPRWGPAVVAEALAALETGRLITPPRLPVDIAWLLLASVPALIAWRRGAAHPGADLLAVTATLLALGVASAAAYALAGQQSHAVGPALALLLFSVLSAAHWRRAMLASASQMAQARAVAEAASRAKSEFLAHMSHEIRTPMNALLGSAEMLGQTRLDARQRRHVALFQSAGASLLDILNDLLDLSKIEADLLELHPQPFSLVDLVASQTVLFEARAAQKGLRLLTEFDEDLPSVVLGDGPRLAQVLRNLLGNAVKFTHDGSVTLCVRCVVPGSAAGPGTPGTPRPCDRLRFEVRDTGIGIAPARQQEIFHAFTQADSGVARAYGGTGLGLTISHRLVTLMGGEIGVDSREQHGAVFHVEVPLPASSEKPVALWAPSSPEPMDDLTPALRLLLADDNPQNVQLVQAYLESDGHVIDVVHDGAAAVVRFREHRYDLVLMDVQMPGMDGYRATAAMREIERTERPQGDPPVPVIALTANAMPDDERRSLQAGCTAHLTKPFSRRQLRRLIADTQAPQADGQTDVGATDITPPPPDVASFVDSTPSLAALAALEGIDLTRALSLMDGDVALYLRVAAAARPALAGWESRFEQAHSDQASLNPDDGTALRLVHDLKSTSATLGAMALATAASRLEVLLRQGTAPADDVAQALAALRPRLAALRAALENLRAG